MDDFTSSFTDSRGRTWTFECNTWTLSQCKKTTGVDLAQAIEKGAADVIGNILGDVALMFDVVCSLLSKQLRERSVDEEEFGTSLDDEDVSIAMTQALIVGVINFSPKSRRPALLKAFQNLWTATKTQVEKEAKVVTRKIDEMNWETEARNLIGETSSSRSSSEDISTITEE
jgi:hypothetical protein